MKTKYFFLAAFAATFASCANEEYIGDTSPNAALEQTGDGSIQFGFEFQNATRADIVGTAAADLLGGNFYVVGTKGTEPENSPTTQVVFDNYLVHYGVNTAGTTASNTANWEYVGVVPGTAPTANYVKLSPAAVTAQTIKYWDYSVAQYDFFGFSTGTFKAVKDKAIGDVAIDEINVTPMAYGSSLATSGVSYTFGIPNINALKNAYITDITEVKKNAYGKDVKLTFKNLGSKVRVGLYETVPGYAVKNVVFYAVDGTNTFSDTKTTEGAALISADDNGLPTKGTIAVYFPNVGTDNEPNTQNYDKAAATVTPVTASSVKTKTFGALHNFAASKEGTEANGNYLGRTLPTATFAGAAVGTFESTVDAKYYTTVFPVSDSDPLTLRVDYTLVSTDGSGEEITVLGAKAVVPAKYTVWLPNYAYTYIFKISDNTNGWTDPDGVVSGLFPITFDAVVTEATDVTGEQTTITTVATPSITTYQQGHNTKTDGSFAVADEYSKAIGKDIYVQVMNGTTLVENLDEDASEGTNRSLLFLVSEDDATEAEVMDALEKRTTDIDADDVKGRNGITLTKQANPGTINNSVTSVVNGVDNNAITVAEGSAAKITISALTATKTYAYVYDYSASTKTLVPEYQPIDVSGGTVGTTGTYYYIATTDLATLAVTPANFSTAGAVDNTKIYFSVTKNGTGDTTYSYYSVAGKATVPAGLLMVAKDTIASNTIDGGTTAEANTFYFDSYISNNGDYAVKIIKIVE